MTIWIPNVKNSKLPKYKALAKTIDEAIAEGELTPGQKLPTQRWLADKLGVTVGTVTRAYAEAERLRLIESKVGSGTFVKQNAEEIDFSIAEFQAPEVIDLGFGFPVDLKKEHIFANQLSQLSQDHTTLKRLLSYQPAIGMAHHRQAAQVWMSMTGVMTSHENRIIITNGGQHGFFSVTQALCQSGDTVLSSGLTYPGFINVAQQLQLKHIGLEMDSEGVTPDSLRLACLRYKPRLLYLNTRLNNPSCEVMSQQRINELAEILIQHQVVVVEDDVLGCLQQKDTPCFINSYPEMTILVNSISKSLAGGLRVGYIVVPDQYTRIISQAIKNQCWMTSPLLVEVVSQLILNGQAEALMDEQRSRLRQRHNILQRCLGSFDIRTIDTAFNVWVTLPEHWSAQSFFETLARKNVLVKPSSMFAVPNYTAPEAIRLCIGGDISDQTLKCALNIVASELRMSDCNVNCSH